MQFVDRKRRKYPFSSREGKRPDIFVFTVDMIPPEFYQSNPVLCYLNLPTWQSLQKQATNFTNAFSVSPLCSGSRAALFTGRYPYILVNEERSHDGTRTQLRSEDVVYPEYLKASGYLCGHVGKSHIGTESFLRSFGENCAPWNRWAPPIWDDSDYHSYLRQLKVELPTWKKVIQGLKPDRKRKGNSYGGWIQQKNGKVFPVEATYCHYLVNRGLHLLRTMLERRKAGQPVYLQIDLFEPHQPFFIPGGLEKREEFLRKQLCLPESYEKWVKNGYLWHEPQPKIYQTYRANWGLYDRKTAFDYLVANILQMEVVDCALTRFVEGLKKYGLFQDAVFLLTADHGEMNLEQGLIDKGVYGHPKVARVPLLIKLPGQNTAKVVDVPVCLLDVAPTILSLARIKVADWLDGENLLPALKGSSWKRKQPFLFESFWHVAPNPAVAIHYYEGKGKHYRYVYNLCSEIEELYDLNDTHYKNLILEPGLTSLVKEIRNQLFEFLNDDIRWRCYRDAFRLDHYADISDESSDTQMFVPE